MTTFLQRRRGADAPPSSGSDPVAPPASEPGGPSRRVALTARGTALSRAVSAALRRFGAAVTPFATPVWRRVAPVLRVVSPLGWSVLVTVVVSAWAGAALGWIELRYLAATALLLFLGCALLTIGRTVIDVQLSVTPARVTVGDPSAGRVQVTNRSGRRLLPITLEIPVARQGFRFDLPTLGGGAEHDELFLVPTGHRGVYPVGPATSVRGDPFGLLRRSVAWTKVIELFVHPVTVPLESLGTGLVRDLEGQTTNDVSMSDLAFHALRDYAPGDDRRYIHWRSSAKVSAAATGGKFLVRQFLDTRRSHITVVVDGGPGAYRDDDEFEFAVSVGASIAARAVRDEMDTTVVVSDQLVDDAAAHRVMDAFARADRVATPLAQLAMQAFVVAPDTSTAFLVTGPETSFVQVRRAASHFPPETAVVAVNVEPGAKASLTSTAGITVLRLGKLQDLVGLMRVVGAA